MLHKIPFSLPFPLRVRVLRSLIHLVRLHTSAYVSIRQYTSAYVSIRQHTSAYVSIRYQMLISFLLPLALLMDVLRKLMHEVDEVDEVGFSSDGLFKEHVAS